MDTPNILKAYRQQLLWPPIHSAVDVFLKRQAAAAEPYELTWRLIHVWECAAITLAEAVIARWIDLGRAEQLRVVREKAYGRSWSESEARLETSVGALNGSIDRWIEIIDYIARTDPGDSPFLNSVVVFFGGREAEGDGEPPVDVGPFLTAWGRACDVTPGLTAGPTTVRHAMKAVNSFRNRLAHVPFPYDPLDAIYKEILRCTEELFGAAPAPFQPAGAMAGALSKGGTVIKGDQVAPNPLEGQLPHDVCYVFGLKKSEAAEHWPCSLFVHVDRMLRPYVLTRLKNEQGLWEYTRFLAESNAVVAIRSEEFLEDFPIPEEGEYASVEGDDSEVVEVVDGVSLGDEASASQPTPVRPGDTAVVPLPPPVREDPPVGDMGAAVAAIRERRFPKAIEFLSSLVEDRPTYHVGWLRLGHARREYAVDLMNQGGDKGVAEELLRDALAALYQAGEHRDAAYQAEAHYHSSKTFYRLWRLLGDPAQLAQALEEAIEAKGTYPESKYESWIEYLQSAASDQREAT